MTNDLSPAKKRYHEPNCDFYRNENDCNCGYPLLNFSPAGCKNCGKKLTQNTTPPQKYCNMFCMRQKQQKDKEGFFDRRVDAITRSLDGRWIYRLIDDDDEDTWMFLDEHFKDLLAQRDSELVERVSRLLRRCPKHATEHYLQPDGMCETCSEYQKDNLLIDEALQIIKGTRKI